MICNMIFAIILVMPMSGNGIALALSLASAINTVFLFIFLGKMHSINIKKVTFDTIIYIFRITALALIAAAPCKLLRPVLLEKFQNYPRLISQGVPIAVLAVIFGLIGVVLLIITKDDMAQALKNKIKR